MVNLCEKDLGAAATSASNQAAALDHDDFTSMLSLQRPSYTLDQVNYCVEMCEDVFKVKCMDCKEVFTRTDFRDHYPCRYQRQGDNA